jgi:hypothetical protein
MSLYDVILATLRNRYLDLPRAQVESLAVELTSAALAHLHRTGALSVPPEDLNHFPD